MEDIKIKANNESERKEIQGLLSKLGYNLVNNVFCEKGFVVASLHSSGINFDYYANVKEITLQYLRHLVVLKRNDIFDANHESMDGKRKYYLTNTESFEFIHCVWVNIDEYVDGVCFKPINKEVKMKEFLNPEQEYELVKYCVGETPIPESWIEVPEGAEIAVESGFKKDVFFYKDNGECQFDKKWIKCNVEDKNGLIHTNLKTFLEWGEGNKIVWQRSDINKGLSTQEKLKFIEKWLNGEKIQYILGVESEKTQTDKSKVDKSKWHNFTEGAMQYIKRPDIKFREAPKYVTINGIEFKSIERLLKHVKNNFDLEDEE